ncbi:CPBP family intramembrane metalloprotease [bacterium]|nr:CPBP family intramembrane metalloprotease [bacterium]
MKNPLNSKIITVVVLSGIVLYCTLSDICLSDDTSSSRSAEHVPLVLEFLPGGTHFYHGDTAKGVLFLTAELSLLGAGFAAHDRTVSELNVPLLIAGQLYTIDKCEYSREQLAELLRKGNHGNRGALPDTTPLISLVTAPFRPGVAFSPFVLTMAALGVIDGIVAYPHHTESWRDMKRVRMYGAGMSRGRGTFWYETSAVGLSMGAALSEEMLFRGILLPSLDYRYGKRTGLIVSSVVFGSLHLFNQDIDRPLYFVTQATAAGFAFGYSVQHDRYRLDKAIAAHFWYNVVSMTTTWLMNPRENPLGVTIQFAL